MRISIIIPTYNAEQTIGETIDGILSQDYPSSDYEVIVADNMSTDSTKKIVSGYPVKYVFAGTKGAAAARNAGVAASQGEWLIFLDSDCVPCEGWLKSFASVFDNHNVHAAGGRIVAFPDDNPISKYLADDVFFCNQNEKMTTNVPMPFILTGNGAYKKAVFDRLGGFDESLIICEDKDLSWRLLKAGYEMKYVSEAVVTHRHFTTVKSFAGKMFNYGYGLVVVYKKHRSLEGWGKGRLNITGYLTLCNRLLRCLKIPLTKNTDMRWRLLLDTIKQGCFLAGKMAGSIQNKVLFL